MYNQNIIPLKYTKQQIFQQINKNQSKNQEKEEIIAIDILIQKVIQYLRAQKKSQAQNLLQQIRDRSLSKMETQKYIHFLLKQTQSVKIMLYWFIATQQNRKKHKILMIGLLLINIIQQKTQEQLQQIKQSENTNKQVKRSNKMKDNYISLDNYFMSISKSKLINFYKEIGQILTNIDMNLAVKCYRLYLFVHHNDQSKFLLGKALIDTKHIEEGINYLNQINYEKYDLDGLIIMGKSFYHLKYLKESLMVFLRIIKIDSEQTCFSTISHFQIGSIFEDMIFHKQSVNHYLQSFYINKRRNLREQLLYWEAAIRIARIYAYNNDHITSTNILSKVIDLEGIPANKLVIAYSILGKSFKIMKNYHKSLYYFKKIQNIEASYQNLQNIGNTYLQLQDYDSAQNYFNRIFEYNKDNCRILTYLAYIKAKKNDRLKCEQILQKAYEHNKMEVVTHEFYQQTIQTIYGINDTSKEIISKIGEYQQAMSINLYQMGIALRRNLKNNLSLVCLSQSLKYKPNNIKALYNISIIFFQCQRFEDCIFYVKQGLRIDQNNEGFLQLICKVYKYIKNDQQYKFYQQKLVSLDSQKANNLQRMIFINARQVEGIEMAFFPGKVQNYLTLYFQGLNQYKYGNMKKSLQIFEQLYKLVCNNTFDLLEIAYSLAKNEVFPLAHRFYSQYFALKPFDKQQWKKYLETISYKMFPSHYDLDQLQKKMPRGIKEGQTFYRLAKLFERTKNMAKALNYAIEAIKYQYNQKFYDYLCNKYRSINYSQEQCWKRILKNRPGCWKAHEELAKIIQGQTDREVYHLQKVMQYSWRWERSLVRLCTIYENQTEKYFMYAQRLTYIQRSNIYLLQNIAKIYEEKGLQKEQIEIYNKIIQINPTYKPVYLSLQKIYSKKYSSKGNSKDELCYSLQNMIQPHGLSNCLVLSFWYSHYNKLQESFACFMFWIEEVKAIQDKQLRKKQIDSKIAWIQQITSGHEDKDAQLKLFILQKLFGKHERAFRYFQLLIFRRYFSKPKERIKKCLSFISYFQKTLIEYNMHQIQFMLPLLFQDLQTISLQKAQIIKNHLLSKCPSLRMKPQNNPLEYRQEFKNTI